ncbi:hypothetical protein C5F48_07965 [Cereibacter changlensis JA139]|uniref:Uncharacterized protein n=2 Tax=Cereibacter changlensis TaxID=402884 RepID=A0A2T4JWQ5_9RHOB|nr:hypothetical protein [Cereibacter changlensis]PTE22315.1 hypothetical protein C5F48_07965 [Cereibacter changlensis JA139]PZX57343.1 hypothetical protein LX76_00885 [Cereibacter changlensis]
MKTIRINVAANPAAHLGSMGDPVPAIADVPDAIGLWEPRDADISLTSGLVSEWRAGSRAFAQTRAARRPARQDGKLCFGNGAGAAKSALLLQGAQIGAPTNLCIAGRIVMDSAAMAGTTFWHALGGKASDGTPTRLFIRPNNGAPKMTMQAGAGSIANGVTVKIPAGMLDLPFIYTKAGATQRLEIIGVGAAQDDNCALDLSVGFAIGMQSSAASPSLPGAFRRFGLWQLAPSAVHLIAIRNWLAAAG